MRFVGLIAACWISTVVAGMASPACAPVPGLAQVLSRAHLQFLLVGEVHGTREEPRLFFDAAVSHCLNVFGSLADWPLSYGPE